ncbi:MAG: M28 family metallopeptidase [Clostridia bacterium]
MKKILVLLLLVSGIMFTINLNVKETTAEESHSNIKIGELAFQYINAFIETCPRREAYSLGESKAAKWISDEFTKIGYTAKTVEFGAEQYSSQNVIAVKKGNDTTKKVVISAHYDSANGEGAFDNGSGIAIMLTLAQLIKNTDLTFDVEFVAFGAEEVGLVGSNYYIINEHTANILLDINLDIVVGGEKLYMYAEDINTIQLDYFKNEAVKANAPIEPRVNMNPIFISAGQGISSNYTHIGMRNDAKTFKENGIATLFLFSGNMDNGYGVYTEQGDNRKVMNTNNDTIIAINKNEIRFKTQSESVVKTVYNGLTNNQFYNIIKKAEVVDTFWYSSMTPILIFMALNFIAVIISIIIKKRLHFDAVMTDPTAKEKKSIFGKPKEDDIFEFRK